MPCLPVVFALLLGVIAIGPLALADPVTITTLFNTGVGGDGTPLADGSVDLHYALIDDSPILGSTYTPNSAMLITLTNFWTPNTSISKWIAPSPDAIIETTYGEFGGNYVSHTTFDLPHSFNWKKDQHPSPGYGRRTTPE